MSQWNAHLDWGHADFIRRHVVTANYTWDLPFGRGRAFDMSGFTNALLGGWRLNGILSKGSGEPYSVSFNSTTTGWPSNRANIVGDPSAGAGTLTRWFNPGCVRRSGAVHVRQFASQFALGTRVLHVGYVVD